MSDFPLCDLGEEPDSGEEIGEDDVRVELPPPGELVEVLRRQLERVARSTQRFWASSMYHKYTRGRVTFARRLTEEMRPHKVVMVSEFMTMGSLDDALLYERLKEGRVVTRLNAATGIGKTRRLPGMIAKRCNLRVCQVVLNAVIAEEAFKAQVVEFEIPGHRRKWTRTPGSYLTVMSYHDFRGSVVSGDCDRLFKDFDVFYFDEAHVPTAVVWSALQFFAAYAGADTSLILASASNAEHEDNNSVARRVGRFECSRVPRSLDSFLDSGEPITKYLRDRTQVVVATDEQVAAVAAYYEASGVDVRMLDSASVAGDMKSVFEFLRNSSAVTPRVVVTTEEYGTGSNLPVSYVISTCTRRVYEVQSDLSLVEREVPLRAVEVSQHKGRTGRGLADGSGGYLLSAVVDDRASEMLPSEALEAYVSLVAGCVRPRKGVFPVAERMFPNGLAPSTAATLLRVELPVALTARFLGSDGKLCRRFLSGLGVFSQPGAFPIPSRDIDPVGYGTWVKEPSGGYVEGSDTIDGMDLCVPFKSPPSLRRIVHTIVAVSNGWVDVPVTIDRGEPVDSDDELVGRKKDQGTKRYARFYANARDVQEKIVVEEEKPLPEEPVEDWKFNETYEMRGERKVMQWDTTHEGKESIDVLLDSASGARCIGDRACVARDISVGNKKMVRLSLPESRVDVLSPGGGTVITLLNSCYSTLMDGAVLEKSLFLGMLENTRGEEATVRFVRSTLFDNWTNAWLSIFYTSADKHVVRYVVRQGYSADLVRLLKYMYDRFRREVVAVCKQSDVFRSACRQMFKGGTLSVTRLARRIKHGHVPKIIKGAFSSRILDIKNAYDGAVANLQACNVYSGTLAVGEQEKIPVDSRRGGVVVDVPAVAESELTIGVIK